LLAGLDIYELQEWQLFWDIEGGFGDMKRDLFFGQLCCLLANIHRNPKKQAPFNLEDFTLRPRKGRSKNNTKKIRSILEALTGVKNG